MSKKIVFIVTSFFIMSGLAPSAEAFLPNFYKDAQEQQTNLTEQELEQLFLEAEKFFDEGTAESHNKAIKKYEMVLEGFKALGNREKQALIYRRIGEIKINLGDKAIRQEALLNYQKSLELYRAIDDKKGEASLLNSTARLYGLLDEKEKQLDFYNQALTLSKSMNDKAGQASVLHNLGVLFSDNGELKKALDYFDQSLILRDNVTGKYRTLGKAGKVYLQMGQAQKAIELLQNALELEKQASNPRDRSVLINDLGNVYGSLKDFDKAIECFQEALSLAKLIGSVQGEATTVDNIGKMYDCLGNIEKGLEYHLQSLALYKKLGSRSRLVEPLCYIGYNYRLIGDYQKSEQYLSQAVEIAQEFNNKKSQAKALEFTGALNVSLNKPEKALECFEKSLLLYESSEYPRGKVGSLYQIALLERNKNLPKSIKNLEEALELIDSFRLSTSNQEFRESYFSNLQYVYELYVDLLMQLHQQEPQTGYAIKALEVYEKSKAQSLKELLKEAQIDIREGIDLNLLEKEKNLRQKLSIKEEYKQELLAKKTAQNLVTDVDKEIKDLIYTIKDVQAEIKAKSPAYAALTQTQNVSLVEIQSLLDENTIMLEYFLGKERSFLWVITKNQLQSYVLPSQNEIEKNAKIVYELLRNKKWQLNETKQTFTQKDYEKTAYELSKMLFSKIDLSLSNKKLLIVSDGALQYIPFSALPNFQNGNNVLTPLVMDNELVHLPSATTLFLLKNRKTLEKSNITVVADPIFTDDDPRLVSHNKKVSSKDSFAKTVKPTTSDFVDIVRSFRENDIDLSSLSRLPFSRQEAITITSLLPNGKYQQFLDFDANHDLLINGKLTDSRILHFATHSIINNTHPDLSGIVLSLVNKNGESQNGFLRLHEIYNLKISADLVVLSACQTGLGKEVRGEGLVGLTRGFMYAGGKQVLASLWKVDDRATAELMKYFYQHLLKENQTPAKALRQAQIQMSKHPRWKSPYYWAAFVLQGDN